jgi:mRNA interferase MazF
VIPGQIVWTQLNPTQGREQGGRRPSVVISSRNHLQIVDHLIIVIPATTTFRNWPNHVRLRGPTGLPEATFGMTEQPRTISRNRVVAQAGYIDDACLAEVSRWVAEWITRPTLKRPIT